MIQKFEFRAMGSRILVAVDSTDGDVLETVHQVPLWFDHWEAIFSRFRPNSELSQLNRSNGKPFSASQDLMDVLLLAKKMREISQGTVTPLVLDALIHSGYDADFDAISALPQILRSGDIPLPPASLDFELDPVTNQVRLPVGVHLDLGGFAKGWSAQTAMIQLSAMAPCLVNAGGDIAISGAQSDGAPWLIGVENPLIPDENIALVQVAGKGVATSGKDYRHWLVNEQVQHHLIDPWTGLPAVSDVFSATVIAADVMLAETASKTAVIGGSENGRKWLDAQADLAYLLQLENGEIMTNSLFEQHLWSADGSIRQ